MPRESHASRTALRVLRGALTSALVLAGADCGAQGVRLMQECPQNLEPVTAESPSFPPHPPYRYRVVMQFIVDIGGTVVAPRIKEATFREVGAGPAAVPEGFESALLAAFAKRKYARQPRPCSATTELVFGARR